MPCMGSSASLACMLGVLGSAAWASSSCSRQADQSSLLIALALLLYHIRGSCACAQLQSCRCRGGAASGAQEMADHCKPLSMHASCCGHRTGPQLERHQQSPPADGHGKFAAGSHAAHAHVQQRPDHARDEALVQVAVPQLPCPPCTACTAPSSPATSHRMTDMAAQHFRHAEASTFGARAGQSWLRQGSRTLCVLYPGLHLHRR